MNQVGLAVLASALIGAVGVGGYVPNDKIKTSSLESDCKRHQELDARFGHIAPRYASSYKYHSPCAKLNAHTIAHRTNNPRSSTLASISA